MAQYLAGTATGPGATYNFLVALRDQMVANGWTVLFTVNASPGTYDFYMRSAPIDSGADNRAIIRFTQTSTINFYTRAYSDWDSGSNTGWNEAGASGNSNTPTADSSFSYWIKANGLAVAWCCKISTTYNHNYAGFLRRGFSARKGGLTKTTGALTIGATSLPVAADMTNKLKVGQKIHILNYAHNNASANKANGETVTISSISVGSIGVSALTKAYDSGALVGQNPYPLAVFAASSNNNAVGGGYSPWHVDGSAPSTPADGALTASPMFDNTQEQNLDPNDATQDYLMAPWCVGSGTASKNGFRGYLYHWEAAGSNSQGTEDLLDDGEYTYVILGVSTANCCALGPREV